MTWKAKTTAVHKLFKICANLPVFPVGSGKEPANSLVATTSLVLRSPADSGLSAGWRSVRTRVYSRDDQHRENVRSGTRAKGSYMLSNYSIRRPVRIGFALFFAAFAATTSHARARHSDNVVRIQKQGFSAGHRFGHYIATHKFPLVVDAVVVLANAADAASTVRATHYCPTCKDYALGVNPSPAKTWGELMGFSAGLVAFNHLAYHHYREEGTDPSWMGQRFFVLMFSVPVTIRAASDVRDNVQIGPPSADLARRRLMAH